jgi:hypothetical protein
VSQIIRCINPGLSTVATAGKPRVFDSGGKCEKQILRFAKDDNSWGWKRTGIDKCNRRSFDSGGESAALAQDDTSWWLEREQATARATAKYGGLSTAHPTMRLWAASVEMTLQWGSWGEQATANATAGPSTPAAKAALSLRMTLLWWLEENRQRQEQRRNTGVSPLRIPR